MRATIVFGLLAIVLTATTLSASAGKLSRARKAARSESSSSDSSHDDDDDDDDDDRPSGKLSKSRRKVRQASSSRSGGDHGHHGSGGHYGHSHGSSIGFFGFSSCEPCCQPPVVVETYAVPQPVYVSSEVPYGVQPIGPALADTLSRQFAPYPYAYGNSGLMLTGADGCGQSWSGQVHVEAGSDFDGLDRTGAGFLIEGAGGFGIDFDWDSYTEDLPGGGHDELHIGEFDVLYRIAETDNALLRLGLGTAWLGDEYDTDFGINFTLKADFAPVDPLVLSGELDLGTLGDAEHLHAAGTVGVMLQRCELYGGYDYRRIGDVEIQGPMVGLRIWF